MSYEYIPGASFFHKLDPRTRLLWFLVVNVVTFVVITDPIINGVILVTFYLVATLHVGIPARKLNSFLTPMIPLFLVLGITWIPLSVPAIEASANPANIFFYMIPYVNWFPVTLVGLVYALTMVIRLTLILAFVRVLLLVTSIKDLSYGIARLRIPAAVAIAFGIALGFIPLFVGVIQTILDAQQLRGWKGLASGNIVAKIRALPPLLVPVFLYGVQRARSVAVAIEARAFGYAIESRKWREQRGFSKHDYVSFALVSVVLVMSYILQVKQLATYRLTISILQNVFYWLRGGF